MTQQFNSSAILSILELLIDHNEGNSLPEALEQLHNSAMLLERARHLQANAYERTPNRKGQANGFKSKQLETRVGTLDLRVPQVRDSPFYPSCLEKGCRSERAYLLSLAERSCCAARDPGSIPTAVIPDKAKPRSGIQEN